MDLDILISESNNRSKILWARGDGGGDHGQEPQLDKEELDTSGWNGLLHEGEYPDTVTMSHEIS